MALSSSSNKLRFVIADDSNYYQDLDVGDLVDKNWNYVTLVWINSTLNYKVYVNGIQTDNANANVRAAMPAENLFIGHLYKQ